MSWEDRINSNAIDSVSIYYYNLVNKWKRYKSEIVIKLSNNAQKMVNAAKIRFVPRNFKILLNCTVGTTLPQYAIYKKQNTGTKQNKCISSAHSILPKNTFNSYIDHGKFAHYLFTLGLPLIALFPMFKSTGSSLEYSCECNSL